MVSKIQSVIAVTVTIMLVAGHGEAATRPTPKLRYMQPADFRSAPWIGDTEAAFIHRFGKPHIDGPVQDAWFFCPNGGVYQLGVDFTKAERRAFVVTRNYCAAIPKATAQLKEAKLFMPADVHKAPTPPDLAGFVFYRSLYLADELNDPEWIWGGPPGTFQVETDDQGGQWSLSLGQ